MKFKFGINEKEKDVNKNKKGLESTELRASKKIDKEALRADVKATIAKYRKTFERLS